MMPFTCGFCGKPLRDGIVAQLRLGDYRIYPGQTNFSPKSGESVCWLHDYCAKEVEARVCGEWYPPNYTISDAKSEEKR